LSSIFPSNSEDTLFWLASIIFSAQILRYGVAFQLAEPPFIAWGLHFDISPLTGLAFGIGYEAVTLYALREAFAALKRGAKRWFLPLCSALVQIVAGISIITPAIVARLRAITLSQILGSWGCWIWSITVAFAPALALVSVALTLTTIVQRRSSDASVAQSDAERKPATLRATPSKSNDAQSNAERKSATLEAMPSENSDAQSDAERKPATLRVTPSKSSDAQSDAERKAATLRATPSKSNNAQSDAERKSATLEAMPSENSDIGHNAKIYTCPCGFQTTNRYQYAGHIKGCQLRDEQTVTDS